VAEVFGRSHKDVLRDIRRLKDKNQDFTAHICAVKYLHRGKKHPCFRISEEGIGILITHSRADKKNAERMSRIKTAYAKQFTAMRGAIQTIDPLKRAEIGMTDALQRQRLKLGKDTLPHHYMNENKMIDRILLGCTIEEYRQRQGHADGKSLRQLLDAMQIQQLFRLRTENQRLIEAGLKYSDRKERLTGLFPEQAYIEGTVFNGDPASQPARF